MGLKGIVRKVIGPVYQAQRSQLTKSAQKYREFLKQPICKKTILYEVRDGKSITDSPKAIFDYFLQHERDKGWQHIWSVVSTPELKKIMSQYEHYPNITFVERGSTDYLKWLAQAEYLINNATFPSFFLVRDEQTYINTWHGTPLKKMGLDINQPMNISRNVIRNFHMADYLISPNAHTTKMYLDAYRLRGGFNGEVLESGYPRIDKMFNTTRFDLSEQFNKFDLVLEADKKILLYAPTWKGTSINAARDDIIQLENEVMSLHKGLHNDYQILIKVHPFLYRRASDSVKLQPFLVPDVLDTNEVLAGTDIIITDYSSIFFDFLVTNKPIIFYAWDEDIYEASRGSYFNKETLPGPICYRIDTVIQTILEETYREADILQRYRNYQQRFVLHEDGNATERYISHIFKKDLVMTPVTEANEKIKLLFYPGGMSNNGITSSFLNLVKNIDYEKYDVTCLLGLETSQDQLNNVKQIPKEVHLLYRDNVSLLTLKEQYQSEWIQWRGLNEKSCQNFPLDGFYFEMRRVLGKKKYDIAIDFSGYSLFWTRYILAVTSQRHVVYLHSDMMADQHREVNGKKIHYLNLKGMFSAYPKFDKLISVSPVLNEVNKQSFPHISQDKFMSLPNALDLEKLFSYPTLMNENKNEIVEERGLYRFKTSIKTCLVLEDLDNRDCTFRYKVPQQPVKVTKIAKTTLFGEQFFKILVNNDYLGWVQEKLLEELPDEVIRHTTDPILVKIVTDNHVRLYNKPYNLAGNHVTFEGKLKGLILESDEQVETFQAQNLPLKINGETIGWINHESTLAYRFYQQKKMRWIGKIITSVNHFQYRSKIKEIKKIKNDCVYRRTILKSLEKQQIRLYSDYTQESKYEELSLEKDQYMESFVKATLDTKTFYNVKINQKKGWINQDDILYQLIEDNPTVLLYEEPFQGMFEKTNNEVYPVIRKRYYTNDKVTYLLEDKQEVSSESGRLSLTYGTYNNQEKYVPYPVFTEEPQFITVGRLSPEKNQKLLIQAFSLFRESKGVGKLWLIGDGPLKKSLEEFVYKLGLQEHVIFTGHIANPYPFMEKVDCFVLTSHYEGQPIVLLEALSLGMKVISTDNPGSAYVLKHGEYGAIVPTDDVEQLFLAMQSIVVNNSEKIKFNAIEYNNETMEQFEQFIAQQIKEQSDEKTGYNIRNI
ncbi:CDP-glycerol glycerophosphotransferase family protein [Vagococcus lutrae]|uniref:CDP-glycerol glycerophosphotransferase family protein n=1 Tax=Vagococcus lutrae TaxID=81947 RepID=A0AAE9XFC5_9ENTE|nr:CDP-glycerol glycerophosphotransferase family protein [Vagococcus lutrae]WCG22726.1 CDP-glycerol glycerophosphotransferase family protein [Vagococcus lutrae]